MEHIEVAEDNFYRLFSGYQYPFATSDAILASKDEGFRAYYYQKAKALIENDVFSQELTELKRNLYAKLALQSMSDVERTAYRTTLIAINDFEKRISTLSRNVKDLEIKKLVDKI